MKVVLLNDTDGRENIGCRLTSSTLKKYLIQAFGHDNRSVDIAPFPWAFGKGKKTGRVWMSGLFWALSQQDRGFVIWLTKLAEQQYGDRAVTAALSADLVVLQPEGSISNYHDTVRIMNLLSLPLLACIKGRCVCTMNGTFPLYPVTDRRFSLIHAFLHACRYSVLRDRLTAKHYNVNFMPDSAIMHELTSSAPEAPIREYVLITTGANLSKQLNLAIAQEAIRFCDENHLKPLILTKKHKDLKSMKDEVVKRSGAFVDFATLEETENWLAQCCLHIGGRYHMALFGLLLNVPSVLILTNTHKNKWLSEDFAGVLLGNDPQDMYEKATSLFSQSEGITTKIRESVLRARECFTDELTSLVETYNREVFRKAASGLTDDFCCRQMMNQLSVFDFLSFWPLGIRLKIKSGK